MMNCFQTLLSTATCATPSRNPAYLPAMDKARTWLVGIESAAVEGRDYVAASTAAGAASRVADIEAEALLLEVEVRETLSGCIPSQHNVIRGTMEA